MSSIETEFDHFTSTKQPDNPWSIKVKPKVLFRDETIRLEIPNTSQIEVCLYFHFSFFKQILILTQKDLQ